MLKLALLRHAKSSWDNATAGDFERPLNARGREAAGAMGGELARLCVEPGVILCSPSRRTRETLDLVLPKLRAERVVIHFDAALYLASAGDLMRSIRNCEPPADTLLVIGHNPGMHEVAASLTASGDPASIAHLKDKFPTAALAVIQFAEVRWRDIGGAKGHLQAFVTPRRLSG